MKYISLQTYNNEFHPKEQKLRLFYNPDNSVAIFEDADLDLWQYVLNKGLALKEAGFTMNPGNAESIRQYLSEQPIPLDELKIVTEKNKPAPLFSKKEYSEIEEELNSKPSAAKLAAILKQVLAALKERDQ